MILEHCAKSRSLESAYDAKTGEQSVFSKIYTIHTFGTPQLGIIVIDVVDFIIASNV
jgi:hypothetical protein